MDLLSKRPPLSKDRARGALNESVSVWLANGFTTVMEMGLGLNGDDFMIVQQAVDEKLLPVDLVAYVKYSQVAGAEAADKAVREKYGLAPPPGAGAAPKYLNRVRVGGVKL